MSSSAVAPARAGRVGMLELPRSGGKCAVCGKAIEPDARYFAAVRETAAGIERIDLSADCWPAFDKSALLAFWQTVRRAAEEKKKTFVDDEVLCTLFERLADAAETSKLQFRFVLGLILMRKRLIVYEGVRRDGNRDLWIVRLRGKTEQMDLLDPKLDESQVAEVSQQLGQILSEEL